MPAFPHGLSRRAVLGSAAALALGTAGCSVRVTHDRDQDSEARSTPRPTEPGGVTADVAVATTALVALEPTWRYVAALPTAFPRLRPALGGLRSMHEAHRRALVDAVPPGSRPSSSPGTSGDLGTREQALRRLRSREKHLHDTFASLALKAESGDFARLLASMATAITLRLPELPT